VRIKHHHLHVKLPNVVLSLQACVCIIIQMPTIIKHIEW
jgi:hypothetical protein